MPRASGKGTRGRARATPARPRSRHPRGGARGAGRGHAGGLSSLLAAVAAGGGPGDRGAALEEVALLRRVLDAVPSPVFVKDTRSRWVLFNAATLQVVGKGAEEVLGRRDSEIYADPATGAALEASDRRVMASGQPSVVEEQVVTGEGIRIFRSTRSPLRDARGEVVGLFGHAEDVTARHHELELEALQAAVAELPIGVVVVEAAEGQTPRAVAYNSAFQAIAGEPALAGQGPLPLPLHAHRVFLPGQAAPLPPLEWPGTRAALSGKPVHDVELVLERADGTRRVVTASAAPVPRGPAQPRRAMVALLDVTEQRAAEAALRANEARYRTLVEQLPVGITESDALGQQRYANPAALALVGRSQAELLGSGWGVTLHPADRERVSRELARAMSWGARFESAFRVLRPDGTEREVSAQSTPMLGDTGEVSGYLGVVHDVTEERRAIRAREESASKLEAALAAMTDAVFISDARGNFVDFNEAFARFHRFPSKAACARTFAEYPGLLDVFFPDGRLAPVDQWAVPRALKGETVSSAEYWLRRKDTGERWVGSYSFAPIRKDGEIVGSVVVARDMTERQRAEVARTELQQQLAQSQKMEVIGRLAGGVAHDFNNLLTIILTCGEELKESFRTGGAPDPAHADDIVVAGKRAADLTRQLLAFARKQVAAPEAVDLNQLVVQAQRLLGRVIGEDVRVSESLGEALWAVEADPGLLTQVIMNLAVNARDAMPGGGSLHLATANVTLLPGERPPDPQMPPGRYVALSVTDSGVGMAPEVQAHLFEPFFTTKAPGEGTGLGLSTVYGIVRQSGGFVTVQSAPGRGSRFELYLPAHAAPGRAPEAEHAPAAGGSETILLVEDETRVREITARALRAAGYRVLAAGTDDEALGHAADRTQALHLLLTDVVMPGLGGRELSARVRALRPEVKVLFVSGYTNEAIHRQGALEPGVDLLPKPYTPAVLLARVRAALGATALRG